MKREGDGDLRVLFPERHHLWHGGRGRGKTAYCSSSSRSGRGENRSVETNKRDREKTAEAADGSRKKSKGKAPNGLSEKLGRGKRRCGFKLCIV